MPNPNVTSLVFFLHHPVYGRESIKYITRAKRNIFHKLSIAALQLNSEGEHGHSSPPKPMMHIPNSSPTSAKFGNFPPPIFTFGFQFFSFPYF